MNNEQTLLDLGFVHHPDWDWDNCGIKHYRLENDGIVYRAWVEDCNPPIDYVIIGVVSHLQKGLVKRWKDCVSEGSVKRFIDSPLTVAT
jgi:hypothetical protein